MIYIGRGEWVGWNGVRCGACSKCLIILLPEATPFRVSILYGHKHGRIYGVCTNIGVRRSIASSPDSFVTTHSLQCHNHIEHQDLPGSAAKLIDIIVQHAVVIVVIHLQSLARCGANK